MKKFIYTFKHPFNTSFPMLKRQNCWDETCHLLLPSLFCILYAFEDFFDFPCWCDIWVKCSWLISHPNPLCPPEPSQIWQAANFLPIASSPPIPICLLLSHLLLLPSFSCYFAPFSSFLIVQCPLLPSSHFPSRGNHCIYHNRWCRAPLPWEVEFVFLQNKSVVFLRNGLRKLGWKARNRRFPLCALFLLKNKFWLMV